MTGEVWGYLKGNATELMCVIVGCGQILYGLVMVICAILTGLSTFKQSEGKLYTWSCLLDEGQCNELELKQIVYMRLVAAFTCLAFIFEIICIGFDLVTFYACCLKEYIIHPLYTLALMVFVFLLTVIIIYAAAQNNGKGYQTAEESYGYTYWLIVTSCVLAAINVCIGGVTVFFAESTVLTLSA